jgi:DNA ligase-1
MITDHHLQHGRVWHGQDLRGWYLSEKLDGCRAFWDGESGLWTRGARRLVLPDHWRLPKGIALDGEIWAGRGRFADTVAAAVHGRWRAGVSFVVFDCPMVAGTWPKRLEAAARALKGCAGFAAVVPWMQVTRMDEVLAYLTDVLAGGGEGIMARHPAVGWRAGRTEWVLKLKGKLPRAQPRTNGTVAKAHGTRVSTLPA